MVKRIPDPVTDPDFVEVLDAPTGVTLISTTEQFIETFGFNVVDPDFGFKAGELHIFASGTKRIHRVGEPFKIDDPDH